MSRGASTAGLLLVLVGLAGYIWFVERKREPADPDAKAKVFAGLQSDQIRELTVRSSSGDTTSLAKEGTTWRITSPAGADVDAAEVSAITSALASLEEQRVVEEQAGNLADFGLEPPAFSLSFETGDEAQPRAIHFGEKTPTGGDMYARLGDAPRVFLVPAYLDSTFDRSTFDLRDKSVLKIQRDKVDGLEVAAAGTTMTFAKRDEQWRMTAPIETRADYGAVEGLVGRVGTAQMKAITEADAANLSKYGLQNPELAVHLFSGSARSTLLLGARTPDGSLYAKDAARPMVFTVDGTLADDVRKAPADFRPKDLFEFRSFTGQRFEVTRDGTRLVFEKQRGEGDAAAERWVQVEPKKDVAEGAILDLLSNASNLRATGFADAVPPGAAQAFEFKAVSGDGKREEIVTVFRAGEDVYATRAGDPGAAKILPSDVDELIKNFDALK